MEWYARVRRRTDACPQRVVMQNRLQLRARFGVIEIEKRCCIKTQHDRCSPFGADLLLYFGALGCE
jgi:hypothetical protein